MKVLMCHNFYQQPGGEDLVFHDEVGMLRAHGHEVIEFTYHNDQIDGMSRIDLARKTLWNSESAQEIREVIRRENPDIMHCANTFPLISPAIYYAAAERDVPVVQTLHNYRLLCPKAQFFRNNRPCEDCLGKKVSWPAVQHGCYRDSRSASAVVAAMTAFHHAKKTWSRAIDRYIVLTQFSKNKFIEGGLPKDRIVVKPNFVEPDPGIRSGAGNYFVFVGRLSPEKGIQTLMDAWTSLQSDVRLRIIGDGPMADAVQSFADSDQRVEWLGRQPMPEVYSQVGQATALIMPSIWYETFGRTIVESYATGTPVIASNLGAMAELVEDGKTGTLFTPGDSADLAKKVDFFANNQANLPEMRQAAREEYLSNYTAEPNYQMLTSIYEEAIASRGRPSDQHLLKC